MAHGPEHPALDETDGEPDRARWLETLHVRTRQLERQRIVASPTMTRAALVALDVELCRVEAAKHMLVHALGAPIPGDPREPSCSRAASGEASHLARDVLCERPGATPRSDRREDRGRPSRTPPLASR